MATAPRTSFVATALRHAFLFVGASLLCYGLLSLVGHSLLSSAHKVRMNSELRTESARADVLELGRQVNGLVDVGSLGRWAGAHGFVKPGSLVATNHVSNGQDF